MKFRILLLGIGFFGEKWIQTIQKRNDCELVAVTGQENEFKNLKPLYGLEGVSYYDDYITAIREVNADIVIIVLPASLHTDAARRAMRKGMHVLSEKPLSFSLADAKGICRFVDEYPNLHYIVDQNYRWRTHNYTVMRTIRKGLIGRVHDIRIEFSRPEDLIGYRAYLDMPLLQDVCIHHFDLLRYFTGSNCKRIFSYSYHAPWSLFQGKATTNMLIEMENDIHVNYYGTWSARQTITPWDAVFIITGDEGILTLNSESEVVLQRFGEEPTKLSLYKLGTEELSHCLNELIDVVRNGGEHETRLKNNFLSYAMVCAAEASEKENRMIDINELIASTDIINCC